LAFLFSFGFDCPYIQQLDFLHIFLATHPEQVSKLDSDKTFADAETEALAFAVASLLSSCGRRGKGGLLITRVNISRLRNFLFEFCYEQPLLFCSSLPYGLLLPHLQPLSAA
jgi:hypothetical protein